MTDTTPSIVAKIAAAARSTLPASVLRASGRVLYTPVETLLANPPVYFLGLNPGGDGDGEETHSRLTVGADLKRLEAGGIKEHAYLDETWKGHDRGMAPIQKAGREVFAIMCGRDSVRGDALLRRTPISNFILQRSVSEVSLLQSTGQRRRDLVNLCWPFHRAVIELVQCQVVLTHAVGAAKDLARELSLGDSHQRPSGWGGTLNTLYAWQLTPSVRLLAMPNLSRYKPDGARTPALSSFFQEFGPAL